MHRREVYRRAARRIHDPIRSDPIRRGDERELRARVCDPVTRGGEGGRGGEIGAGGALPISRNSLIHRAIEDRAIDTARGSPVCRKWRRCAALRIAAEVFIARTRHANKFRNGL